MTILASSYSTADLPLSPAPIRAEWITEGRPVARNRVLSRSKDRTAMTLVWDCTAGRFTWIYDEDETILVLEGGVTLRHADGRVETLGPGDVAFFPAGCTVDWTVERYVRKLAFFRQPLPGPLGLMLRAPRKLAAVMGRGRAPAMAVAPSGMPMGGVPAL